MMNPINFVRFSVLLNLFDCDHEQSEILKLFLKLKANLTYQKTLITVGLINFGLFTDLLGGKKTKSG